MDDVCDLFDESLREQRLRRPLGVGWTGERDGTSPGPQARLPTPSAPGRSIAAARRAVLAELRERPWSASSLEVWIGCPVRWFVERLLRPDDLDPDPEPLARGGLAHAALKDTLEGLRRETGSARVTPARLGLARELLRKALAENEPDHPLSSGARAPAGGAPPAGADLERYLEHAAEVDSPLEPAHLELGFGFAEDDERGEGSALPAFDLGGGVMLRGRIDRVDVGADGEAVVYDYKGRSAPPAAKWIEDGNLQVALYMRAVEQLLGLRAVGGFYQPLTGADLRARGRARRRQRRGARVRRRRRPRARGGPRAAGGSDGRGARGPPRRGGRGELQPRPPTCAFSGGCMYPTICRCERDEPGAASLMSAAARPGDQGRRRARSPTSRSRRSRAGASRCCWPPAPGAARPRCWSSAS